MQHSEEVPAISVRGLSKRFLKARGLTEVMLSVPFYNRLAGKFKWFHQDLQYKQVLSDLSFDVPAGCIYGIFGFNGAGKSTLISILANILSPDEGTVLIHGRSARDHGVEFGNTVAKCSKNEMYDEFTARENIEYVARLYGVDVEQTRVATTKLLELVGMTKTEQEGTICGRHSVGNRGKVALACSLVPLLPRLSDPQAAPILLLDEPTSGFDVRSVQRFFEALQQIRRLMPQLTIVIATNDPREAALVDDYVTVSQKSAAHDLETLEKLKCGMAKFREGVEAFGNLLDGADGNGKLVPQDAELPPVEYREAPSRSRAVVWRALLDLGRNYHLTVGIVLMLVLPNLIGFCAMTEARGRWAAFAMTAMGTLVTLMVRESQRLLERERSYFCTLETLLMAPLSRRQHFFSYMKFSWAHQVINTVAAMTLLALFTDVHLLERATSAILACTTGEAIGLALVVVCVMVATQALGLLTCLTSFVMRPTMTWLIVGIVPTMVLMCSGIYNAPASLPWVFRAASYANPIAYGASSVQGLLRLGPDYQMPLTNALQSVCPELSSHWANLICCLVLTGCYLALATWIYIRGIELLRKIGRLRNNSLA